MPQAKRSTSDLHGIWEHLAYEIQMLSETAKVLSTFNPDPANDLDRVITNALIESFTLHARSLIAFLYLERTKPDDALAEDFLAEPSVWRKRRPPMSDLLKTVHPRVAKEVAHLTYARVGITPEQRRWPFVRIVAEVYSVLHMFVGLLPPDLIKPSVPQIPSTAEVFGGITDVGSKGAPGSGARPSRPAG